MQLVSEQEHDLLSLAQAVVEEHPWVTVRSLIEIPREVPKQLAPTAMHILQDGLAKGVLLSLMRLGGWKQESFLGHGGTVRRGRWWERHTVQPLEFSAFSLEILQWLVGNSLVARGCTAYAGPPMVTVGDEYLTYLLGRTLEQGELLGKLVEQPAVHDSVLLWLAFPDVMNQAGVKAPSSEHITAWVSGQGGLVLEALQGALEIHWRQMEFRKATFEKAKELRQLGISQQQILRPFLAGIERARRRDLASFLVDTAGSVLRSAASAQDVAELIGKLLERTESMMARQQARQAGGALWEGLKQVEQWHRNCARVHFIDDDYDEAQMLLARWELLGAGGFERGSDVWRSLTALDAGIVTPAASRAKEEGTS
jgi:hypothetical protein